MTPDEAPLAVEVAYALASEQTLLKVALPRGSTIRDAIERSGISRLYPEIDVNTCVVGVYGTRRALDAPLSDGDRVEIYRALIVGPTDARRFRAGLKPPARRRD